MMLMSSFVAVVVTILALTVFKFRPDEGQNPYGYSDNQGSDKEEKADACEAVLPGPDYKTVSRSMPFVLLLVGSACFVSVTVVQSLIAPFLQTEGLHLTQAATVVSCMLLGTTVAHIVVGVLVDRFSVVAVLAVVTLISIAGWLGIIYTVSLIPIMFFGFQLGFTTPLSQVIAPVLRRRILGMQAFNQVTAVSASCTTIASAMAFVLFGVIIDSTGFTTLFIMAVIICVVASSIMVVAYAMRWDR